MDTESVQVMVMMQGLCASRRRARYTHRTCGYRVLCLHCLLNRDSNKNDKKESKTTPVSQYFFVATIIVPRE